MRNISDYIHYELSNPFAAERIADNIIKDIEKLRCFPLMGANLSALLDIDTDFKYISSGKYLIFYHLEKDKIYIDRILNGKRDYMHILFDL